MLGLRHHLVSEALDCPKTLKPVGGVGLPSGLQGLLDDGGQVAVERHLADDDGKTTVRNDLRFLTKKIEEQE